MILFRGQSERLWPLLWVYSCTLPSTVVGCLYLLAADMSNSIETPIDIDFFGGIDIGIDIDSGYP